jgi:fructokinase
VSGVIAVVGEALFDAHLDGDGLSLFPGGGPFNTAVALGRLGVPVGYLGALSRDRLGHGLLQELVAAGVDTSRAVRVDAPTPLAILDPTEDEPSYTFYLAGTAHEALREPHLQELPGNVVALHAGTLALATDRPGAAVAAFVEREASRRVLMLDPNIRPTLIADRSGYLERLERLVEVADLVKLSDSDLAWLYPGVASSDAMERLRATGAGCVVLTRGRDGAEGRTRSASARVGAPDVAVVDTVGAGDAFGAGLLAWLRRCDQLDKRKLRRLAQSELEAALRYAVAAGAAQCTRPSAWGPTAADVEKLVDRSAGVPS